MKKRLSIILVVWLLGPTTLPAQQLPFQLPPGMTWPQSFGGYAPGPQQQLPPAPQVPAVQPQQPAPPDLQQMTRRYCSWVSWAQSLPPSYGDPNRMPFPPNDPRAPQARPPDTKKQLTPIKSPWPGAPNYEESPPAASQSAPQPAQQPDPSQPAMPPYAWNLYEPPSAIELSFAQAPVFGEGSSGDASVRQYGYSLFSSPVSTFAPVTDVPVGPDYLLGPGDDLMIQVWGAMESGVLRTVDRNGQIVLPGAGPLRVWGLSFSQAQSLIGDQLARHYPGFQSTITMGRLRTIRVYVVGDVCQPGSFTLSSLSTVTNALFAAGGPLKLGSLRNIRLKRNHHDVGTVDLYDFLLRGDKTRDFRLESGDTIFVPPIGHVAAIDGEVKRPGIYEINGATEVSELIEMAGGPMPRSYLKRVQLIRAKPNAERQVVDLDLSGLDGNGTAPGDAVLRNGDLVRIYPADPRIYNTVALAGAVKHPGEYELRPGMRLSQLVYKNALLPESYLERVEVVRLKDDLTTEILQFNLKEAWAGDPGHDVELQPRDRVTVRTEYRSPFRVTLGGEVKRPGTYTIQQGETLSSLLRRAGGYTDKAFFKGAVFIRKTVQEAEKKRLDDFVKDQEQRMLNEASQLTPTASGLSKEEAIAQQAVLSQRREQLKVLASKVTLGRVVVQLDEPDKLEGTPKDLALQDGDSLTVPQEPATVLVMGSVRNPTGILHQEEKDVQYYLNRAGGMTPEADPKGMHVIKADGSAITGFMRLREIEPGDVIVVPPSMEAKIQWLPLLKDLATIAGQVALGLAGLAAVF